MSANTAPVFVLTPHVTGTQFANADGTTKKTVFTPGTNGSRIDGIFLSTNDSANENVAFYINDGTTDHYLGNVPLPLGSGYTTVARVDALGILAPATVRALILPSGYTLKANMVAAVTSADITDLVIIGGDY